ncbi:MAG: DUF1573 domain-containing protein [Bacteroidetes bacterium]|nr:MAG: DUF1573 domain-containing protein [Bacteroidota bacterium]REK08005.1 MAG: DUF1573 domain-containing protein [Bacteroidota bacterium]REK32210.1 MAG: DUF1573 domain-containing protein [Bacteroidota bacterium]REK47362.1 MAG: DUF1573 domain-containing protein [Bacteroidota bacterium]
MIGSDKVKQAITYIFFILFSVIVNAQDNKNSADIRFDIEEFNFGTIKQGEKIEYSFTFVNSGKEPLIISDAKGTCGCTVPSWSKEPIPKGGKGSVNVEFNSTGKLGMQDKTVTIISNAKSGPKVLRLKGNIETTTSQDNQRQ